VLLLLLSFYHPSSGPLRQQAALSRCPRQRFEPSGLGARHARADIRDAVVVPTLVSACSRRRADHRVDQPALPFAPARGTSSRYRAPLSPRVTRCRGESIAMPFAYGKAEEDVKLDAA
jgi:hypothetical protein